MLGLRYLPCLRYLLPQHFQIDRSALHHQIAQHYSP
jgi:hypothetical protein